MVIITLNSHFSTFNPQLSTLNFQPSTYYSFPHKMSM